MVIVTSAGLPETMRLLASYIITILLALAASESFAQRSCVFLPESGTAQEEYDRPKAKLHLIRPLSIPQSQSLTNSAPDFPNVNVSSFLLADQDETSIAINPIDPNNIIIGANDYRSDSSLFHFESFDGGKSWTSGSLRSTWIFAAFASDPAVAFNASGKAFYSYGRGTADSNPINDVICHHSSDGGKNWSLPVRIILDSTDFHSAAAFADKYYIAVDNIPGSPFRDRIYVSWVEYDQNHKDRVKLSFSSDDGLTWSKPADVSPLGNYQSPIPAIGLGGNVYVAYENIDPAIREIHFRLSNDGGKTFPLDKKISGYNDLGPLLPTGDANAHPTIKGALRANSFPSIAVDYSAAHHGRIYITWAATGDDNRHHIFLVLSDNGGNSWSAPKAVENDPSPIKTDKFFPWIAVDDANGDVGIAYYDSRSDTTNVLTDLYMLFSNDGAQNFTPERISGASSDVRAVSLIDTSGPNGPRYFFGDYNGLAAYNKFWHPAWTDSRVGYDQDIYSSIVRPYAPSAPRNFTVTEDTVTHLPNLSWEHTAVTTFGAVLGDFVFRLKRLDGGLQIDLPKTARSYTDVSAVKNTDYQYTLQAVTADNDTSITQAVNYSPRANREPLPPVITSAKAQSGGLTIYFRVPDKNIAGTTIANLSKIYYLVNGIVRDSFRIGDDSRGKNYSYRFGSLSDGYYRIQLAASTKRSDTDTTLSGLSSAKWLYAGTPLTSYSEDFTGSKNIFTPFAWDTTRAGGKLPSEFINDSLPDVPYRSATDSWFLLPPVTMNTDAHTIEFIHIALVAPGDSATVEVSTNDGVDYFTIAQYDKQSHPKDWTQSLSDSRAVHEALALKYLMNQDAIVRFRLLTHSSGGDGWFLDSIQFTSNLAVSSPDLTSGFRAELTVNPLRIGSPGKIKLFSDKQITLTVNMYSLLGKKEGILLNSKPVSAGEYELEFSPGEAGCYFYEVIARSARGEERRYGKFVVIP